MPKFIVSASELVFYQATVEANTLDEAKEVISSGDVNWGNPIDGCDFEIVEIKLNEEIQNA